MPDMEQTTKRRPGRPAKNHKPRPNRLREFREMKGFLNLTQFARMLGVKPDVLNKAETIRTRAMGPDKWDRAASILKIDPLILRSYEQQ